MGNTHCGVFVEASLPPLSVVVRSVSVSELLAVMLLGSDDDIDTGGGGGGDCGRSDGKKEDDGGVEMMNRTGASVGVLVATTGGVTVIENNRVGDTEGDVVVGGVGGGPGVILIISPCTTDSNASTDKTDNNCRRISGMGL
jgi:hypothetical protein